MMMCLLAMYISAQQTLLSDPCSLKGWFRARIRKRNSPGGTYCFFRSLRTETRSRRGKKHCEWSTTEIADADPPEMTLVKRQLLTKFLPRLRPTSQTSFYATILKKKSPNQGAARIPTNARRKILATHLREKVPAAPGDPPASWKTFLSSPTQRKPPHRKDSRETRLDNPPQHSDTRSSSRHTSPLSKRKNG